MYTDLDHLCRAVEALLFVSDEPLSLERLLELLGGSLEKSDLQLTLERLKQIYANRSIELRDLATGYQFQVRLEYKDRIERLFEEKPQKYSNAFLETLAIIAYRQPVTRGEIEQIRGVTIGTYMIKTLQEHGWIRLIGRRDVPGRPGLYATTKKFLEHFGLKSLDELPSIETFNENL